PSASPSPPPPLASYAVTLSKPSTISHCFPITPPAPPGTPALAAPPAPLLVTARCSRLEVSSFPPPSEPDAGLTLLRTVPLHGHVACLAPIPLATGTLLFVLTSRLRFCILDVSVSPARTVSSGSVAEKIGSPAAGPLLLAASATCVAVHAYAGYLRVLPLTPSGSVSGAFTAPLPSASPLVDLAFLHGFATPHLALLAADGGRTHLQTLEVEGGRLRGDRPWQK
ncbi:hypothetical protein TeGR_g13194, partial [Tetraparma gracilis]